MIIHFKIIGILLMLLGLMHLGFPKKFNWKTELKPLSLINKQMMEVHTFYVAFTVFLFGILCFTSAVDLTGTAFGRNISLGLGIFWGIRLFIQFFIYSPKLWHGKKFETVMHFTFSVFWLYLTCIFLITYFKG